VKPDRKFWERVQKSRERVLVLDYDGTIAPFRAQRLEARPLAGMAEAVASIRGRGDHVALVTGRTLHELDEVSEGMSKSVAAIGSHGWEVRWPGEAGEMPRPGEELQERIDEACAEALAVGGEVLWSREQAELRVECKPAGVAVHVRGLRREEGRRWIERVRHDWARLASDDFNLLEFNGGLEMRLTGRNKGTGVVELLGRFPGADLMVYVGDDVTDEDAFGALPAHGVGIKVGREGETRAVYRLADCEAVREFLRAWAERVGR
jgi:trehalose 6-phosphate phosphatase